MVRRDDDWPEPWATAGTTGRWVLEGATTRYIPENSGVIETPKVSKKMSNENEPVPSYFETWLKFLRDSTGLDIKKKSTPYLKVLNSRDGYSDHYAGELTFPDGKMDCTFWDVGARGTKVKDRNGTVFAYIDGTGVRLMVDPETVRWHDETPEGEARRHPAFAVLGPIEEFFKTWNEKFPERLADSFMGIRKERLRILEKQRIRNVERLWSYRKDIRGLEEAAVETRRAHKAALDMTRERFLESAREWLASPAGMLVDRFDMQDNSTVLHTKSFVVEGVNLGPYTIALTHKDLHVSVNASANISHRGYCHPHVSGGDICWGRDVSYYKRIQNTLNPVEILIAVADFLHTGYSAEGAYHKLYSWGTDGEGEGFYDCNFCASNGLLPNRHPDDENCPQYCHECENSILSMAWHRNCWNHGCYNIEDGADDQCPECRSEEEEEARRARREREAVEAEERDRVRMSANIGRSVAIRNCDEIGFSEDGEELEIISVQRDGDDEGWEYELDGGSVIRESWFEEGWVEWVEIAEEPADVPTDEPTDEPAPTPISDVGRSIRILNTDVASEIDCSDGFVFIVTRTAEPDQGIWLEVLDGTYFIEPGWFDEGVVEWVETDAEWAARGGAGSTPPAEASPDTHGPHNIGRRIFVVDRTGTSLGTGSEGNSFEVLGMMDGLVGDDGATGEAWYSGETWNFNPVWFESGAVRWADVDAEDTPDTHGPHNIGRTIRIVNPSLTISQLDAGQTFVVAGLTRRRGIEWYQVPRGPGTREAFWVINPNWFDNGSVEWVEEEAAEPSPDTHGSHNIGRTLRILDGDVLASVPTGTAFEVQSMGTVGSEAWYRVPMAAVEGGFWVINPDWFGQGLVEWVAEETADHGEHNVGRRIFVVSRGGTTLGSAAPGNEFEVLGASEMDNGDVWYRTPTWNIEASWFDTGAVRWAEEESAESSDEHGSHNIGRRLRILENTADGGSRGGAGVSGSRRVFEIMGTYPEDGEVIYRVAQDGSAFTDRDDWVIRQRWFENGTVEWVTPEPAAEENIGREIRILRPQAVGSSCIVGTTVRVDGYDGDQHYYRATESGPVPVRYIINESAFEALNVEWVANARPWAEPEEPVRPDHGEHNVGRRIRVISPDLAGIPCDDGDEFHIVEYQEGLGMYHAPVDGGVVNNGNNWGITLASIDTGAVEWLTPVVETRVLTPVPADAEERAVLQEVIDTEVYREDCSCEQCLRIRELGMAPAPTPETEDEPAPEVADLERDRAEDADEEEDDEESAAE